MSPTSGSYPENCRCKSCLRDHFYFSLKSRVALGESQGLLFLEGTTNVFRRNFGRCCGCIGCSFGGLLGGFGADVGLKWYFLCRSIDFQSFTRDDNDINFNKTHIVNDAQRDQLKERIRRTFGDWTVLETHDEYIQVLWDFSNDGFGLGYGIVVLDSDGYYTDWCLEKTHESGTATVCVQGFNDATESTEYLLPNGTWAREPYWYSPKRAVTLKNKTKGREDIQCLFWYQV